MTKIVLASASPRRKELLTQIGIDFSVQVSTCEEKITKTAPADVVCELSRQKAEGVWQQLCGKKQQDRGHQAAESGSVATDTEDYLVIGADTVVAYAGEILGKPKDEADACRMLETLSANTHEVFTGVTFCYEKDGEKKVHTFYEQTEVTFYPMSREEIESYVATKDPLDKAGAYGIQGSCAAYIKGIRGDYNNVVGLPIGRLYQELKEYLGE